MTELIFVLLAVVFFALYKIVGRIETLGVEVKRLRNHVLPFWCVLFLLTGCQSSEQQVMFPRQAMYNDQGYLGFHACLDRIQQETPILARLTYADSSRVVRTELIPLYRIGGVWNEERQCRRFNFMIEPPVYVEDVIAVELTYVQDGM